MVQIPISVQKSDGYQTLKLSAVVLVDEQRRFPEAWTQQPKPYTPNPKPQTPNPNPQTPNPQPPNHKPQPQTPNPKRVPPPGCGRRPEAGKFWQGCWGASRLHFRVDAGPGTPPRLGEEGTP
jgi:hypothetical protein